MEAALYNQEGAKVGIIIVPDEIFSVRWNPDLVKEALDAISANRRKSTAKTKDRAEVRGGGRKPWRQKGTGRARHGSIRSPIWIGGGVTHGPVKERDFSKKINKKAKRKALAVLLSKKIEEGEIFFLENIELEEGKTKKAAEFLKILGAALGHEELGRRGGRTLLLIEKPKTNTIRAIRNLPYADAEEARNLNVEKAATPKYLVFTKEAVSKIAV